MIRQHLLGRPAPTRAFGAFLATVVSAAVLATAVASLPAQAQSSSPRAGAKPVEKPAAAGAKSDPRKAAAKPDAKKPDPKAAAAAAPATPGKPDLVGTFGEWGAYATSGKAKTCYALGRPKDRQPTSLKRDPGYLFVSFRPAESVRNEVSLVMGFDVKPDSSPTAEIGASKFDLIAKGANLWIKNAAAEGQFVDALRKGSRLVIKAESKRGSLTTDTYVLSGIAPALERVQKDCQ